MLTQAPIGLPPPRVLSTATPDICSVAAGSSAGNPNSAVWAPAAGAHFYPVPMLDQQRTYIRAFWLNGVTAAGNVDVGVYTISGTTATRVMSTGAILQAGVSVMQVVTPTAFTLNPYIQYYLAMMCSLGTATVWRTGLSVVVGRPLGCAAMTAANPLPASGTIAWQSQSFVPFFGFSEVATI